MVLLRRVVVVGLLVACRPDLSLRQSFVDGPRILAVRSVPAEAETKQPVSFEALIVDPSGKTPPFAVDWAMCIARKPLAELEPVNPICTSRTGDFLIPLGQGPTALGTIPSEACRLFGPEVPAPKPGEPFGRPTDPDPTGGYSLPIRVILAADRGDEAVVGTTRLSCGVAGAASGDATDFRQRYHVNSNPLIAALKVNGISTMGDTNVAAGPVRLEVDWPTCPDSDACGDGVCGPDETETSCAADCASGAVKGCGGAERYVYYDAEAFHNVTRRESMRISWFATSGAFAVDVSGREEVDLSTSAANTLTLSSAQRVLVWVVLRDARGGAVWQQLVLNVQ